MKEAILTELAGFKAMLPAKGRAVGIHLAISLAIFLCLLYLIAFKWYPHPYFSTDGGWQGIQLMFGVDVVLGPVLTFVVFNSAKPRAEIIRDLSLIALIQMGALSWGIHTVHSQRPVAIVALEGSFGHVTGEQLAEQNLAPEFLKKFDSREPAVIFERVPRGEEAIKSSKMLNEGKAVRAQTDFYERLDQNLATVFWDAAKYEATITAETPELKASFAGMRARYGADVGFLPYNGRYSKVALVITRRGELVDSVTYPYSAPSRPQAR